MGKHKQGIFIDEKENIEVAHALVEGLRTAQVTMGEHFFIVFQVSKNKITVDSITRFHPVALPGGSYLPPADLGDE